MHYYRNPNWAILAATSRHACESRHPAGVRGLLDSGLRRNDGTVFELVKSLNLGRIESNQLNRTMNTILQDLIPIPKPDGRFAVKGWQRWLGVGQASAVSSATTAFMRLVAVAREAASCASNWSTKAIS